MRLQAEGNGGHRVLQLPVVKVIGGEIELKEYECLEVGHHKDVGSVIEEWQDKGWHLHTYQATGRDVWVKHYLLFERER